VGALPKRKISPIRRDRKRAAYLRLSTTQLVACPQCHTLKRAYHVCPSCGSYNGQEVIEVEEKKGD
jgi:large subunit ribosomal protein L32